MYEKMAIEFDITDQLTLHLQDVKTFIKNTDQTFDYIFAGPPISPVLDRRYTRNDFE